MNKLPKCGLCGKEVDEQPRITSDAKCSECGAELTIISKGEAEEESSEE